MSDLRTALEEAFAEKAEESTEVKPEPTPEPEQTEQPRDEAGKFAKEIEQTEQTEPTQRKAPSSWKPAAQEAFLKADRGEALTPEEIKLLTAEAERRESDFHKGVSEFKSHSERAKAYDAAIAPYQAHLQRLGVDAPTAISALMRADTILRTSDPATKAQYFSQLAREYGIDLNSVQEPPQLDPQTNYLMSELQQLRNQQQMWQNQIQQQEQARANSELTKFATADKAHFDAVRGDMADLLETGKAKTLEEAYDMAVWMRQDIRQSLLDQQRAEAQKKALEQAQAQKARTAAVSVKGSSPVSGGVQPGTKGSLRDIIAAQFDSN
jgi:hypothetical protein